MAAAEFLVGLSRDLLDQDGGITFDASALAVLDRDPLIDRQWFPEQPVNVTADHLATMTRSASGARRSRVSTGQSTAHAYRGAFRRRLTTVMWRR
jgi:hypothetical protein